MWSHAVRFASLGIIAFFSVAVLSCKGKDDKSKAPELEGKVEKLPEPKSVRIDVFATEEKPSKRLALLLPSKNVKGEIFHVTLSPRMIELAVKLKKGAAANPEQWLKQTQLAKEGEPVPYHPAFGMTKAEYKEFLSLSTKVNLKKVDEVELQVNANGNEVTIKGLPGVAEVHFDTSSMTVKTPFGNLSDPTVLIANDKQKIAGPMNGFSWGPIPDGLARTHTIKLFVAQPVETLDVLMELRIRDVRQDKYLADFIVRYQGPSK